jgi:hypothetical protein
MKTLFFDCKYYRLYALQCRQSAVSTFLHRKWALRARMLCNVSIGQMGHGRTDLLLGYNRSSEGAGLQRFYLQRT